MQKYLTKKRVKYELVEHEPTVSSMKTAEACHIPGDRIAKAVLLRDDMGYAIAVLPASHHIRLSDLKAQFGDDVRLASKREIAALFEDCARGAIPALGECYGLDTVIDDSIEEQPEIYIEGGDHATLGHMSQEQFADSPPRRSTAASAPATKSEPHPRGNTDGFGPPRQLTGTRENALRLAAFGLSWKPCSR